MPESLMLRSDLESDLRRLRPDRDRARLLAAAVRAYVGAVAMVGADGAGREMIEALELYEKGGTT
jgi:hypothetical protein